MEDAGFSRRCTGVAVPLRPAWHSLCCGRAQQLPALAWPLGAPVGQGKLGFWDFPGLWPAGSLPLERGTLLLASGQLFSQTKVQGRRLGTPADLYSSGSGFRPQRPRKQPQVRVGTSRRPWRAVGGDLHHPKLDSAPQAVEQWGGGSLEVSPFRAGCVCQAGVAWAQSLDKGLQQRRPSPVGSWVARSRAVCGQSPPPACPGPDTSRNQRQERRCLEAFLWCLSLPSRGCG